LEDTANIEARSSWPTCKNGSYHCAPF